MDHPAPAFTVATATAPQVRHAQLVSTFPAAVLPVPHKDGGACSSQSGVSSRPLQLAVTGGTVVAAALAGTSRRHRRRRCNGSAAAVSLSSRPSRVAAAATATDERQSSAKALDAEWEGPEIGEEAQRMNEFLAATLPEFADSLTVGNSREGTGLGTFAREEIMPGTDIYQWPVGSDGLLIPSEELADQFELGWWGSMGYELLRESRLPEDQRSLLGEWVLKSGAKAPKTHPLKLVVSHPEAAQLLWTSTTLGGEMSGKALQMNDDLELLEGSATVEEWSEVLALGMSKTLHLDREGRPLLCVGLDCLQDAEFSNCEVQVRYEELGGGMFEGDSVFRFSEVALVATRRINQHEELSCRYLEKEHAGAYIEQYGFIPQRLQSQTGMSSTCTQLSFSPAEEDEDDFWSVKYEALENEGISDNAMDFVFGNGDSLQPVHETSPEQWEDLNPVSKMNVVLRLRELGGKDSYLLDAVYAANTWGVCFMPVSEENDYAVAKAVVEECDMWLQRFKDGDESVDEINEIDDDEIRDLLVNCSSIRGGEAKILGDLRSSYNLEIRQLESSITRRTYWTDREMMKLFPQRQKFKDSASYRDPGQRTSEIARKPRGDFTR